MWIKWQMNSCAFDAFFTIFYFNIFNNEDNEHIMSNYNLKNLILKFNNRDFSINSEFVLETHEKNINLPGLGAFISILTLFDIFYIKDNLNIRYLEQ